MPQSIWIWSEDTLRIFQLPKRVADVYQICMACSGIHNRFKSLLFMFCDVVEVSDYTPGRLHHPQSTRRCDQDTFSVSSYHHIFGCRARTSHVVGAPQFAAWYIRSRFILSFYPTVDKEERLGGEGEDKKWWMLHQRFSRYAANIQEFFRSRVCHPQSRWVSTALYGAT